MNTPLAASTPDLPRGVGMSRLPRRPVPHFKFIMFRDEKKTGFCKYGINRIIKHIYFALKLLLKYLLKKKNGAGYGQ